MTRFSEYFNEGLSEIELERKTRKLLHAHYEAKYKDKWGRILEEEYKVSGIHTNKDKTISVSLFRKIAVVAASFLLVLTFGWFYSNSSSQIVLQQDTQQLLSGYLADRFDHPGLKKGVKEEGMRSDAINAYTLGDYHKSIKFYQQLKNLKGEDFVFMGLSFLYNDQAEEAIPLLQESIEMVPFDNFRVSEEINWQLILAYLSDGQIDNAKVELKKLVENKSGKRHKDASILLQSL